MIPLPKVGMVGGVAVIFLTLFLMGLCQIRKKPKMQQCILEGIPVGLFSYIPSTSSPWHAQAKRGGLANTDAIDLLAAVMKGVIAQTHIDPKVWRFMGYRPLDMSEDHQSWIPACSQTTISTSRMDFAARQPHHCATFTVLWNFISCNASGYWRHCDWERPWCVLSGVDPHYR